MTSVPRVFGTWKVAKAALTATVTLPERMPTRLVAIKKLASVIVLTREEVEGAMSVLLDIGERQRPDAKVTHFFPTNISELPCGLVERIYFQT